MAGFLLVRKSAGAEPAGVGAALSTFAAKKLAPGPAVEAEDFALYLFQKRFVKARQIVHFPGGDFAAAVGTLFYKGKLGEAALHGIYRDHGARDLYPDLCGQFAVVLRKRGKLSWFNDYFGVYHVFGTEDGRFVSSSLLAAAAPLRQLRLSRQALYEYLFDGAIYGADTLFEGVKRMQAGRPAWAAEPSGGFDEQVDAAVADLLAYFEMLGANFGDSMLLGLSGGYDSRLLLAAALKAGIRPRLFVGGAAASADVRIAAQIAAGEGLEIEHLDSAALDAPQPERFRDVVGEKLAYYDGIGIRGAINDGEEYHWRLRRMAPVRLELNGGGGEIYRDFWKLPERRIWARDFVRRVMDFKNRDKIAAMRNFDRGAYREALVEKLGAGVLTRPEVARLYTTLRSCAFAGPSCKEMNLLGHSLLPFAEPRLALPSYRVPLRYKACGRFEAEMIRRLSPRLAALPTSYGYPFSAQPPFAKRLREGVDRHCRSMLPLPLIFLAYRLLRKKSQYNHSAYCYSERHLRSVVDMDTLAMADYVDPERIRGIDDPFFLSRVLTVETLLTTPWRDAAALPRAA